MNIGDLRDGYGNPFISNKWRTVFDVDFTAEPSLSFPADNTYSLGGYTWTKFNTTYDQTTLENVNGTGLVIQPNMNSDYNASVWAAPSIWTPLDGISSDIDWDTPMRIWIYISTENSFANYRNTIFGIDSGTSSTNAGGRSLVGYRGNGTVAGLTLKNIVNASAQSIDATVSLNNTSRVVMLDIDNFQARRLRLFYGSYNTGWTSLSSLTQLLEVFDTTATRSVGYGSMSNMGLLIGAVGAGSGGYSTTIARVRMDIK
jgi:hypothetical protein